ncbi:cyclic nucleotide-gated ion channel 1-like [Citrus sinensis]|nr:cyclic nucleotide-gated ion channel 1 [Citrus x clementina]XP_006490520.1 cyclic nucleotide-gated ion channel 1-like [Citrus sinensis]
MSRKWDLEQGTAGRVTGEPRNGTNSVSVKFQRDENSGVKINGIIGLPGRWFCTVIKHLLYIKKLIDPRGPSGSLVCLIFCVIAIFLDPLFFYIPVTNDDKKCLRLDKNLGIAAIVLRSVFDVFYTIYIIFNLHSDVFASSSLIHKEENSKKFARKNLLHFFLIDLLAILPLPQVVILIIMPTMRGSKFLDAMKLLKFLVFFQYVPRVIRIYPLFTKATRNSSKLDEATWAKAVFNLLLYLLAAHVFGALWYFFSIERETVCWKSACRKHAGCNHGSFYCDDHSGDYTFLNEFCPIKPQNTKIFDFGIFHDALESGIVEMTDFPQKLLHCFFWGLQSLSCLGQNLNTSTYIWEDFFAILITISGLMLFLFLIGNMQIYLQSKTIRSEEMRLKVREIEQRMPFQKLSGNLQQQIKKYQQYVWRETKGVDVENLISNLPRDLRRNIKRELCLDLLKKVEEFKKLDEATLDALCDCVKPAFFIERAHIVREDYPIDEMLFVVQGKLWNYTSKSRASGSARFNNHRDNDNKSKKDHLKDGDFCGEELVAWAMDDPSSSNLPISTRTIQALTKVEAFALMADDLKNVFINHQLCTYSELNWKNLMTQAARVIQDAWRRYHTRRNSTRSTGEIDSSLQVAISQGASLLNALQGINFPNRTPQYLPQPQGETETIVEEPEFNIT